MEYTHFLVNFTDAFGITRQRFLCGIELLLNIALVLCARHRSTESFPMKPWRKTDNFLVFLLDPSVSTYRGRYSVLRVTAILKDKLDAGYFFLVGVCIATYDTCSMLYY